MFCPIIQLKNLGHLQLDISKIQIVSIQQKKAYLATSLNLIFFMSTDFLL